VSVSCGQQGFDTLPFDNRNHYGAIIPGKVDDPDQISKFVITNSILIFVAVLFYP
jgi:hypothetical protein